MSIPFTYVYLIYDPHTGLYKIGQSDDPEKRLKQLCNPGTVMAAPSEYELKQAWLCPPSIEKEFHQEFAEYRVRGEWFDLPYDRIIRLYDALSWYRRLDGNEPEASIRAKRYYRWFMDVNKELETVERERDSLLKQRTYLVAQRNALITFNEEPSKNEEMVSESL